MRSSNGVETQENCLACKWREKHSFCNAQGAALHCLQRITQVQVHRADTILFREGQAARGVFILCNGSAKISTASRRGNVIILSIAQPGEVLGIEETVANQTYQVTAELLNSCQVKFIPQKEFMQYLSAYPQVALQAVRQLTANSDAARDRLRIVGSSISGEHKLSQLLETWAEQAANSNGSGYIFAVPFTHEEISQMIGSTRETVTRALNELKRDQVIEVRPRKFTVRDMERLRDLATK